VEVGIDEISLIECENSERVKVNLDRCEKVAISAMKQSKQAYLPRINSLLKLEEYVNRQYEGAAFIAWCETDTKKILPRSLTTSPPHHFTILIGPEGDFTHREVSMALEKGFQPLSLGSSRLRTETAALYVCAAINVLHSS
jgi:16S rRNA (uracil1498-N3)-methyltransferase